MQLQCARIGRQREIAREGSAVSDTQVLIAKNGQKAETVTVIFAVDGFLLAIGP